MPSITTPPWILRRGSYLFQHYGSWDKVRDAQTVDPLTGKEYIPLPAHVIEAIEADDECQPYEIKRIRKLVRERRAREMRRKIFWADLFSWLFNKEKIMRAEVYTKPNCPYCVRAKALLEKHKIPYTEISAPDHRSALIERVVNATGAEPRTVPQIFLITDKERYIGGHDQLVQYFNGQA